jgi:glycosyltransferase involved in cell wall biosynthesis
MENSPVFLSVLTVQQVDVPSGLDSLLHHAKLATDRRGQVCVLIAGTRSKGAVGQNLVALAEKLSAKGDRVVLLFPGPRMPVCDDLVHNPGIAVWPSRRPTHAKDAIFLLRLIAKIRPTHVIANFGSVNLMMTVAFAMRVRNRISWYHTLTAQIEMDSHQGALKRNLLRIRKSLVYRLATDIVTNSGAGRHDVMKTYSVPPQKITVFPNCIADPLRAQVSRLGPVEGRRIVCVGRLDRSKGQDVLIHAFGRLRNKHPNATIVFIGSGPLMEENRLLAQRLGVSDQCSFLGAIPHVDVLRQLSTAAISVVPSRSEAFGYVNIESMAVATPLVASNIGGISEIVRDGIDGFLVPPDDSDTLADRLSLLLTDRQLRDRLGQNARQRFLERYERDLVLDDQVRWIRLDRSRSTQG